MEVNLDFSLAAFHKASAQSKFVVFLNNMEMLKMYTSQPVSSSFMIHIYDSCCMTHAYQMIRSLSSDIASNETTERSESVISSMTTIIYFHFCRILNLYYNRKIIFCEPYGPKTLVIEINSLDPKLKSDRAFRLFFNQTDMYY